MERLRQEDFEALLHAVVRTRFVSEPDLFPQVALETVRELVDCSIASFNDVDPDAGRLVALVDPPDTPIGEPQYEALARLAHEHPLIRHLQETGDGSAMKLSDFLTIDELHETALYREVYAPLRVEHQISITLPAPLPRIVAIALSRSDVDFDERDRELLNAVRPHLAQSYQLAQERKRLRSMLGTLTGALREHGTHVVALETAPRELTPGAADLLRRYFGPSAVGALLPARVERWIEAQSAGRTMLTRADLHPLRPLTAHRDGTTIVVRYIPGADNPGTLVFHERPAPLSTDELLLLGLTRREAEILRQIAEGASDREIASRLHLAPGTVRKHLDNLYRKLGVRRRTQAVATALELLAANQPADDSTG